jgi:hypothetical protein
MESAVRWLRISYWVGAIADALAVVMMLSPRLGAALLGATTVTPGPEYRYAMGLGASLMAGWTALLVWADRRPLERRGVLPLTVFPVVAGLMLAGGYAVARGIVPFTGMLPTWIMQVGIGVLFTFSYRKAGHAAADARR